MRSQKMSSKICVELSLSGDTIDEIVRTALEEVYETCDDDYFFEGDRQYYAELKPALVKVHNHFAEPDDHLPEE